MTPSPQGNVTMISDEIQQDIAAFTGRLLRDSFGKGPESVHVTFGHSFVYVYLRNFIAPMEKVLIDNGQGTTVLTTRQTLMETLLPEYRSYIKLTTGNDLCETYYDWELRNRSGMIFGIAQQPFHVGSWTEDYKGKSSVHEEISTISQKAQKRPDEILSCLLNSRTLVVIRSGILVAVEKELLRLGHESLLRIAKGTVEKHYLRNYTKLEDLLGLRVTDAFIDWNFQQDRSVTVMMINGKV